MSIKSLIGNDGEHPRCVVIAAANISMHWFKSHTVGEKCLCGLTTYKKKPRRSRTPTPGRE